MKKLLRNRMRQLLSICMTYVLLTLGIATGLGCATPVQAAEMIPISSAEDFMNMESNPSGSYYLTKDITLPPNMEMMFSTYDLKFTGTLDGKGHKLKNYTVQTTELEHRAKAGIFGYVENATFKNFSLTNVNIDINAGEYGAEVAPFGYYQATGCTFDKIKVSGTITVRSTSKNKDFKELTNNDLSISGLIGQGGKNKVTNCSSSLKIKVSGESHSLAAAGLAGNLYETTLKNCSFSGDISVNTKITGAPGKRYTAAGICSEFIDAKVSGCKNSGNITVKVQKGGTYCYDGIHAYGIGGGRAASMSSCGNTGKIKAEDASSPARAAGLVEKTASSSKTVLTKCWNKGNVSASGNGAQAGGICIETGFINQCYNKGAVSASGKGKESSEVGGLCMSVSQMQNCYNVGKVTLNGSGYAGGLASFIKLTGNKVSTANYSAGAVSIKNGGGNAYRAALFPAGDLKYAMLHPKCYVYNNYYTASTGCKAYGHLDDGNTKKTAPQATKVSSITSKSCPKLSSKYWTYSSKYKRLVLKNNKEK